MSSTKVICDSVKSVVFTLQISECHMYTHLHVIYYEVCIRDGEAGLSKEEYNRFLGRLNRNTKQIFKEEGTFEEIAGEDHIIDLVEFEELLDKVIEKQEQSFLDQHVK